MREEKPHQAEKKALDPPSPQETSPSSGSPPLEIKASKRLKRLSWDEYFMGIAEMVARRSTCPRKRVGAVIVKGHMILSTGYNGSIRGMPHCDDVGCDLENNHCVATIHAEANALIQAARHGVAVSEAMVYVTASPCWNCFKLLANAGIRRIVYREFYRDERIFEVAKRIGIELVEANVPL